MEKAALNGCLFGNDLFFGKSMDFSFILCYNAVMVERQKNKIGNCIQVSKGVGVT